MLDYPYLDVQVLWDVATGEAICGNPTHADFVLCCRFFSNQNDKLITAGNYNLQVCISASWLISRMLHHELHTLVQPMCHLIKWNMLFTMSCHVLGGTPASNMR